MTKADFSTHENIERAMSDCTSNLAEHCSTRKQMIKMRSSRTKRLVSPVTPDILNHVVLKIKKMRIESFREGFRLYSVTGTVKWSDRGSTGDGLFHFLNFRESEIRGVFGKFGAMRKRLQMSRQELESKETIPATANQ